MSSETIVRDIENAPKRKHSSPTPMLLRGRTRFHRNARTVAILLLAMAAGIGAYPLFSMFYATTDDAQVDGHIYPLNSRINGSVVWVNPAIEDTRFVKAGTVIARLDPDDYSPSVDRLTGQVQTQQSQLDAAKLDLSITKPTAESKLQGAKAAVEEAQAELDASIADAQSKEARLAQSRASYELEESERKRYEALVVTHEISRSEYDQRATAATTAKEQMAVAAAELKAARTKIEALKGRLAQRRAELVAAGVVPQVVDTARSRIQQVQGQVKESQAQLREARLNLGYTTISAPVDGVVGQRQIEVGQRVQSGQLLLTVVPTNYLWVTAYFKETQLRRMRVGQQATVKVDATGQKLVAHVESIGGATGAKFSLLPPENSTGNFVKVVQRVPVRLRIDNLSPSQHLLPGMSVEASVQLHK